MGKLLNKAKTAMTNADLSAIIDDISNIAKILTNPGMKIFMLKIMLKVFLDESGELAEVRRTGQEMAIRRGQSSKFEYRMNSIPYRHSFSGGLLPKAGTRSPSSIVPTVQDVNLTFL